VLRYLEKVIHPRWPTPLEATKRLVGIVVVILNTTLVFTPIPLSNVVPALVIHAKKWKDRYWRSVLLWRECISGWSNSDLHPASRFRAKGVPKDPLQLLCVFPLPAPLVDARLGERQRSVLSNTIVSAAASRSMASPTVEKTPLPNNVPAATTCTAGTASAIARGEGDDEHGEGNDDGFVNGSARQRASRSP
jgi:hypothetical protein